MFLTSDERDAVANYVAAYILHSPANIIALVKGHATRISTAQPPLEYSYNIVDYCILSGWIENPALIITLLEKFQDDAAIASIIEKLKRQPKPVLHSGRPSNTALVALKLPFIGRELARNTIDQFIDNFGGATRPRVLIVNGGTGMGKTFTYDYIS